MTIKKKIAIALGCVATVAVIVATTIAGTVAYLAQSAAVSNVFTIGNVTMTMTESKVNPDGELVVGGERVDTNTYHLVPNKTYVKDPVITVGASDKACESSYLFIIARNDIKTIEDHTNLTMREQLFVNGWIDRKSVV